MFWGQLDCKRRVLDVFGGDLGPMKQAEVSDGGKEGEGRGRRMGKGKVERG